MITNYLSPLEFQVTVNRLPEVEFFTQTLEIPSVSAAGIVVDNPFNYTHITPNKVSYSNLNLSFIVDENMKNYMSVFYWMTGVGFPQNYKQFEDLQESEEGLISDISIIVMNSNKNPNIIVNFKDCFPVSLSPIKLDTTSPQLIYPTATATFTYTYFNIEQYNN
jgi:hypothetical protein